MRGLTGPRGFPPSGRAFVDPRPWGGASGSGAGHSDWPQLPLSGEVEVAWEPGEPVSMSQRSVPRRDVPRMRQLGCGAALVGDVARPRGMHARLPGPRVEFSWFPRVRVPDRAPEWLHGLSWPRSPSTPLQGSWGLDAHDLAVGAAPQAPRWHGPMPARRGRGPRCCVPLPLPRIGLSLRRTDGWVGPAGCCRGRPCRLAPQPVAAPPALDTRGAIHWPSCVPLWSWAALAGVLRASREHPRPGAIRAGARGHMVRPSGVGLRHGSSPVSLSRARVRTDIPPGAPTVNRPSFGNKTEPGALPAIPSSTLPLW